MKNIEAKRSLLISWGTAICLFSIFLCSSLSIMAEYPKAKQKGMSTRLNRFKPDFQYLINVWKKDEPIDQKQLDRFIQYYSLVIKKIGPSPSVYALLGYCYYQKGDKQKSIDAYKRSASINPHALGVFFNLGAIYYNEGNYKTAADYFAKALVQNYQDTPKGFLKSSVYVEIIATAEMSEEQFKDNLAKNYADAIYYLGLSFEHLGKQEIAKRIFASREKYFPQRPIPEQSTPIKLSIF